MLYRISISLLLILFFFQSKGQNLMVPLWEGPPPNARETDEKETKTEDRILWIEKVQEPRLDVFLPAKNNSNGQGVIICPGGGYHGLAYDWEGTDIAKALNAKGIAAFVLKYRLPHSESVTVKHETPLLDAQRAIKLVRKNATEWNVKPNKIGVMGFSAGGHLAATLGTHFDRTPLIVDEAIDTISARPDFMVLCYPVVTMKSDYTHMGSRDALIGKDPSLEIINLYSNELNVDESTPPTFLMHAADDRAVPVENSLQFYKALKDAGVYTEMHLYPYGGHGFSLAIGNGHLQTWPDRLFEWLAAINQM